MPIALRLIYASANGDRWFLATDHETGDVFVRHEPNAPSGGRATHINLDEFLGARPRGPQHEALIRLIASLIEDEDTPGG